MKTKLLALLLLTSPALAQNPADLPHFLKVNDGIYRGGRPTEAGLEFLKSKFGIKTVINLQGGDLQKKLLRPYIKLTEKGELPENIKKEGVIAEKLGMVYLNYPLNSLANITEQESVWIQDILVIISDPTLQPVYIHCEHGHDRTGMIIALERVINEDWSIDRAKMEWRALGHGFISRIFTGKLDKYFNQQAALQLPTYTE